MFAVGSIRGEVEKTLEMTNGAVATLPQRTVYIFTKIVSGTRRGNNMKSYWRETWHVDVACRTQREMSEKNQINLYRMYVKTRG